MNGAAKKWAYVNYSTTAAGVNNSYIKQWGSSDDFNTNDRVITVSSTFTPTGTESKVLAMAGSAFSYPVPANPPAHQYPTNSAYRPADGTQLFTVYGVDQTDLRMPYNRADYYLRRPSSSEPVKIPQACDPGTGILFKGAVNQADGSFSEYPLLNCVGDIQVEFELDTRNDGNITYSSVLTTVDSVSGALRPMTADEIRSQLKIIRVYILAHEGKKDPSYSYPGNAIHVGDPSRQASSGRTWNGSTSCSANCMQTDFGPDWRNYRWKVYTLLVRPKNLN
jgi:hypothetical protein